MPSSATGACFPRWLIRCETWAGSGTSGNGSNRDARFQTASCCTGSPTGQQASRWRATNNNTDFEHSMPSCRFPGLGLVLFRPAFAPEVITDSPERGQDHECDKTPKRRLLIAANKVQNLPAID